MKYFCIPNHRSRDVIARETIHDYKPSIPPKFQGLDRPQAIPLKNEWKQWESDTTTDHLFYNTFEGSNPQARVSMDNPPRMLHGVVADYDAPPTEGSWEDVVESMMNIGLTHKPTWISRTFSGYYRCVWEFEEALPVSHESAEHLAKTIHAKLNTTECAAGFDKASWKPAQYFELGTEWRKMGEPLTREILLPCIVDSEKKTTRKSGTGTMDLEWVQSEIESRGWADRIDLPIEWGMRSCRFWDDDDNHARDCGILNNNGFRNFSSSGQEFYTWGEIFGKRAIEEMKDQKAVDNFANVWHDGTKFYSLDSRGYVRMMNDNQAKIFFKVHGVEFRTAKENTCSELDEAMHFTMMNNNVDAAAPIACLWNERVVDYNGNRLLNTSRLKPLSPVGGHDIEPEKDFPFVYEFLNQFFYNDEERDLWLHFAQRFYRSMLLSQGRQGPTLILVGNAGTGKTLITNVILGGLVGGAADASKFVSGDTSFTDSLADKPVWAIDDGVGAVSYERRRTMTEIIKATSANPRVRSESKHRGAVDVPWYGRVTITANTDSGSIRSLPSLDASNRDKLLALRINEKARTSFPPNEVIAATLKQELPHFAQYLLDWVAPPHCFPADDPDQENQRFGGKFYINSTIEEMILQSSNRAEMVEMVEMFCKSKRTHADFVGKDHPVWAGTALEFQKEMLVIADGRNLGASGKSNLIRAGLETVEDAFKEGVIHRSVTSTAKGGMKQYRIDLSKEFDVIPDEADLHAGGGDS